MNVWSGEKCRARVWGRTNSSHWPNMYFEIYILSWLRSKWEKPCAINHITYFPLHALSVWCVWARASMHVLYQYNTFFIIQSLFLDPLNLFVYVKTNMNMSMNECCCYHFSTIIYINKKTCNEKMYSYPMPMWIPKEMKKTKKKDRER